MKKIILLFAVITCCLSLRAQNAPEIKFDHTEYSFGQIHAKNGKMSHTYPFTNTGNSALIILSIETSCGCTKAEWSKKPIPPAGKGEIVITYDPKKQAGIFYKAIQVFTNAPRKRCIIIAQGEVLTDE